MTLAANLCLFVVLWTASLTLGFVPGLGGLMHSPSSPQWQNRISSLSMSGDSSSTMGFDDMEGLVQRLDRLESAAPDILMGFYEPHLQSFSVKPGSSDRLSVTSTCYALLAIQASTVYDKAVVYSPPSTDTSSTSTAICIPEILGALLRSKWREEDLFQVPLLLYTLLQVDHDRSMVLQSAASNEEMASKIRQLIEAVLKARPKRRMGDRQAYSDYIIYQICKALALLQPDKRVAQPQPSLADRDDHDKEGDFAGDFATEEIIVGGLPPSAVPEGAAAEISLGLARCAEVSSNELCRQLAYRSAGDTTSFDVMRLAYSLLTYARSTQTMSGVAGRELVPGKGVSPGTQVTPLNKRLVIAALDAFFAEQNGDGLWDQGQPIFQSFRRQGRSVGNAFVFSVDTVSSLLRLLPAEYFRPHLQALERTLNWIEGHENLEVIPDYCDPETGECYGKALKGWISNHLRPDAGPQAWSTAQVLACVSLLKTTIRECTHTDVLKEFGGTAYSEQGPRPESWDRLLDTDLGSVVQDRTIKSVLEERVVTPFASSIDNPSFGAAYSAILHGPPGTAKTTICEALAQKIGFDFVVIDTSDFLADGLSNVANRIRYVFRRLMALRKCVILFDEIEEFALDRETPGLSMESRMLTTSMLTAINDLRKGKQSIFFVATNRLRAFDPAITRPGRFDMALFVGTPNLDARVIQFRGQSSLSILTQEQRDKAIDTYRAFLESVWTQDAVHELLGGPPICFCLRVSHFQ